jgi:regulator of sirC expression with transglutaminase-like and TPR domain
MTVKRVPSADELRLLVSFLNDSSEQTVALAHRELADAVHSQPNLRAVLEQWSDPELKSVVREMLEDFRLEDLFLEWETLARQGVDLDLERGAALLARVAYPAVDPTLISRSMDEFAEAIDDQLDAAEGGSRQAQQIMSRYLFQELGFRGNTERYDDPDNTFMNRVLERRLGLPITLSCLYLFVGWRLNLPVYGVGLPGHFIAAHVIEGRPLYIDAFQGGRVLTASDCAQLVRRRGIEFQERFLFPMSKDQILSRMILNLITVYTERGHTQRAQWLGRVLTLLQDTAA